MNTYANKPIFLQLCGFVIEINLYKSPFVQDEKELFAHIIRLYRPFLIKQKLSKIDFTINIIHRENIELFSKNSKTQHYINFFEIFDEISGVAYYAIRPVYLQVILRYVLLFLLSKHNGFLMHASAIKVNGQAILFSGKSGTGKSTLAKLLSESFPQLSDDVICIRKIHKQYTCFQTPFIEKSPVRNKQKKGLPIQAVFLLKRHGTSLIYKIKTEKIIAARMISSLWSEKQYLHLNIKTVYELIKGFKSFYCFNLGTIDEEKKTLKIFLNNKLHDN